MRSYRVRAVAAFAAVTMAVTLLPIGESAVSAAVPTEAPTGLAPDADVTGNPQMSWDALDGAARYRVQISESPTFGSTIVNHITYNTTYTPTMELPVAPARIYWRVAGMDSSGSAVGPWTSADFVKTLAAPTLQGPADNAEIDYRTTANTFSWAPTPTTKSYVLEIDDAPDFVGSDRHVTRSTSYTPNSPLSPGQTYYWRVRGSSSTSGTGVLTAWSDTRQFTQTWSSAPVHVSPAWGETVTDLELEWEPVPGARYYNVHVDPSQEFNDPMALKVVNGHSTRVTHARSLDNASYWWRVQAVDSRGNLGTWSEPQVFNRNWLAAPTLVAPAAGAQTSGPLRFEWNAVDHASTYTLEVSTTQFFTQVTRCSTVQTSIYVGLGCDVPQATLDGPFYWRVRATDVPSNILGIWSETRQQAGHQLWSIPDGTFDPATPVTPILPSQPQSECMSIPTPHDRPDCTFHASPTFFWAPVAGADRYVLRVALDPQFTTVVRTYTMGKGQFIYQPVDELPDTDADQAYYWHVQACSGSSNCGLSPEGQNNPTIELGWFKKVSARVQLLTADADLRPSPIDFLPHPTGETVADAPRFQWRDYLATTSTDVADPAPGTTDVAAREYQIEVSTVPTFSSVFERTTVDQTFHTPWARTYPEGPLFWRVRARDGSGNWLSWSETGEFFKSSPTPTPLAPTGTTSGAAQFRWTRVDGASSYDVEVYRNGDTNYSSGNRVRTFSTEQSEHTLTLPLTPGDYAWRILRRDADARPGEWQPGSVFTVQAATPGLTAPADGALVGGNDLLFRWNGVADAASYRIQRSTTQNFASGVSSWTTVMTSYAPLAQWNIGTYWWRVQALDASNEVLGTSEVRSLVKDTLPGAPTGVSAARGDTSATVSWTAPMNTGGSSITGYTVYPYDGPSQLAGHEAPATARSLVVPGLTNGRTYTFRVAANNGGGRGPLSASSNAVTPSPGPSLPAGSVYVPITPCRVVDTRSGGGGRFLPNAQRNYQVSGSGSAFASQGGQPGGCSIPATAMAVEASVTAVNPNATGFFRAWPTGEAMPNATFLNFTRNQSVTNTGAVKLNQAARQMTVRNYSATSDYVIDVQGYYVDGSAGAVAGGSVYVPITPCRIVDTRNRGGNLLPNVQRNYRVTGGGSAFANQGGASGGCGIPAGATAVEGSVSAVTPGGNGYFRAWPTGESVPNATFLNYTRNQGITNTGAIKLATSGTNHLTVRNYAATSHYVIDVQGYFMPTTSASVPPGSVYVPITPCRIVDTRNRGGIYRPNVQRNYRVTGTGSAFANQGGASGGCGIPAGATAVEGSISAVSPEGAGYARAWPTGESVPNATFINYTRNQGITNTGAIKLATTGTNQLTLRNYSAQSHYVIDVQGYYLTG